MKVLLAASEVAPIVKMGGLGDVVGSLPKALEKLGINADVVVPFFPFAKTEDLKVYKSLEINVPFGGQNNPVSVFNTKLPGSNVDVILLQNSAHFLGQSTTWKMTTEQELDTFSFFDRAVVEYIKARFNTYDLIHCHDWHTGLITHLLQDEIPDTRPGTLFTVHNLMYQGVGTPEVVRNVGIVPGDHPLVDWDVEDGDLNMIQQGVTSADYVNTVSETYMKEILTPEFGGGLEEILQAREGRLAGILNGIDYSTLPRGYDEANCQEKKTKIKKDLQERLGLKEDADKPLFAFVGRLDPYQKGVDLLYQSIPHIIEKGGQFVLLGMGDEEWGKKFLELSKTPALSENYSAQILFDSQLSQQIYSASDFLLVPSRYEPCGLIQMIGMWYGSLPIARATGGLKDSVKEGQNGFLFEKYDGQELINAVDRAFSAYAGQGMVELVRNAMSENFSWEKSAQRYKDLYNKVVQSRINTI